MSQDGNLQEEWVFIGPKRNGDHRDRMFLAVGGHLGNGIKLVEAAEVFCRAGFKY